MGNEQNKRVNEFKKAINNMIATSDKSYNGQHGFTKGMRIGSYTKEEILNIIEEGQPSALRQASLHFLYSSGFYRRFLIYYATLLKYTYLLIPHLKSNDLKIEDPKYFKKYQESLNFIKNLNVKLMSKHIAIRVLGEGAYYGILRDYGKDGIAVQDLPASYCRSRFKNQANVDIVEIDLTYFDSIRDNKVRAEVLDSYPQEIKNAYWNYKNRSGQRWFVIEPGQGLYFKLVDERPFFCNILPAVIDFKEYRELEKEKDKQDIKNLLVQQMPIQDGELVFDPDEIEEFHRGSVMMLRGNSNMDVLTTPAAVKVESLESNRSTVSNNLEKIANSIYDEAGVSKQLFSAENNTSLKYSVTNDLSLMMILGQSIANWIQFNVNERFGNGQISFKVSCLPITYYNESEIRKDTLSMAQYGYSFLIPLLTLDLDQSDLVDIKALEIDALKLNTIMIPLSSSYTSSSSDSQSKTERGTPGRQVDITEDPGEQNRKAEEDRAEKTNQNINGQ